MKTENPSVKATTALLQRFEPVIRSTSGDKFYPMDVEPYVRACSLWVQRPGEEAVCVVPGGKLSLDRLAQQPMDEAGAVHFLKFTDAGDLGLDARGGRLRLFRKRAMDRKESRRAFRAGRGRLARVGYFSRFVDALYSITLLARGRVPGESAAAASVAYERIMAQQERYRYHGRVLRQDGWIVLQYWLFYPFNDWRSNFFGANDHEADWEKVFVYLSESESGEILPEWVAYAAHEEAGDRLRRRWDDPELEKIDEHPVVYVCAGSHASRYFRGEYLTELEFPLPRSLARARKVARLFWYRTLRQYAEKDPSELFTIPFVDYGRGDGLSVGPAQDREWDPPRLMQDPVPSWVSEYRGLWGLYTRDPFEGEDAPSGPMYDRDKTVSREWYDPVGWAGLDKVPTRAEELADVLEQRSEIEKRRDGLRAEILQKSRDLRRLGIASEATRGRSHLRELHEAQTERIAELSREVAGLREELSTEGALSEALDDHANRLRNGERPPANAHIARAARPLPESEARTGRVAQLWASISVAVVLLTLTGILFYQREHLLFALVFAIAVLAFVEAGFRKRLDRFMVSANIGLSVVGAFVLLDRYFWQIIVLSVLAVGLYILWENLRELGR